MNSWEDIQERRNKFLKRYYRRFRTALHKTIQPLIEELKITQDFNLNYDALINKDLIEETFLDLYGKVGVAFYRDFQPKKRMGLTEDEILWEENMREWCTAKYSHRIVTITETVKKESRKIVNSIVAEGMESGMASRDIVEILTKRLPNEYRRRTLWMARRIVDTEVHAASNMSVNEAAKQSGQELKKVWLTAPPGTATVERHTLIFGLNNQEVPIDGQFNVAGELLEFPGDPNGSPANTINCNCSMVHKRAEGI
jgi:hypothetical protein